MNVDKTSEVSNHFRLCNTTELAEFHIMDGDVYESLLSKTKASLTESLNSGTEDYNFAAQFCSVLEDCRTCINQCLNSIPTALVDNDSLKIIDYLENAVSLLHLLSSFLRKVVGTVTISRSTMKDFPLATGQTVLNVFTHCKESETLYGRRLINFERQLKDLFRNCHQLQLVYLMILEKHYIFDHSEMDDLHVLIDALTLNLSIGEIVLSLDVKTMAEQWKAITALCEKYYSILLDKDVFNSCIQCLSNLIADNIKISMQEQQEQKIMLRSFKVTNFLIKILTKIWHILKQSLHKDYQQLIDLLCYVKTQSKECLNRQGVCDQIIILYETNVSTGVDNFITELLTDRDFYIELYQFDVINMEDGDTVLGYLLLIINILKSIAERDDSCDILAGHSLEKLLDNILSMIPLCYKWSIFSVDMKRTQTDGLYESLLLSSVAVTAMFTAQQFIQVERNMYEAVMSKDCYKAVFAADLWNLLIRGNANLQYDHLMYLCKTYSLLEHKKIFLTSPQRIHLAIVMKRIFMSMSNEEKAKFCTEKSVMNDENIGLWSVLGVKNLPQEHTCQQFQIMLLKKLTVQLNKLLSVDNYIGSDIEHLIRVLEITATCPLLDMDDSLKDAVLKAWSKLCQMNIDCDKEDQIWIVRYTRALSMVLQTMACSNLFSHNDLLKILHVMSTIEGVSAIKLVLLNLLLHLSLIIERKYSSSLDAAICDALMKIATHEDDIVKVKVCEVITQFKSTKCYKTLMEIENRNPKLRSKESDNFKLINYLELTHKCYMQNDNTDVCKNSDSIQRCEEDFEFADIDSLLGPESDSEEVPSKKPKLKLSETDDIINRLESDTDLLCKVLNGNSLNGQQNFRMNSINEKLKNIIS